MSEVPYQLVPYPTRHHPRCPVPAPESVAAAVIEFVTGALVENLHRVGRRLRGNLAGIHSTRRGTYRVLYRINENQHEVIVLHVDHRRDEYRPR